MGGNFGGGASGSSYSNAPSHVNAVSNNSGNGGGYYGVQDYSNWYQYATKTGSTGYVVIRTTAL